MKHANKEPYRVILDYGPIEIMVIVETRSIDTNDIYQDTLNKLQEEGFTLPDYDAILTIEHAPEWKED